MKVHKVLTAKYAGRFVTTVKDCFVMKDGIAKRVTKDTILQVSRVEYDGTHPHFTYFVIVPEGAVFLKCVSL